MGVLQRFTSSVQNTYEATKDTLGFSEDLSAQQQFNQFFSGMFQGITGEFIDDIFGDSRNTPHDEMQDAWRMLQNNIQVAQAISKKALLIKGRELSVESENDQVVEFFEDEILPGFRAAFIVAARNAVAMGNGYIRVLRGEQTGSIVGFEPISRAHKMYVQYSEESLDEAQAYVLKGFKNSNVGESHQVQVSEYASRTVQGERIPAEEIIHLRIGHSAMPLYGRSDVVSGIDDYKISREIKRALGVSARHKMFPRKLFLANDTGDEGGVEEPTDVLGPNNQEDIEKTLNNLGPDENPVFHNTDIDVKDYDYDPDIRGMQEAVEKLDRDLTSFIPPFLTHATDSNRSTSKENRHVFQMEITSIRETWKQRIDEVFQEIVDERETLSGDVSIVFGEFSFPTREEKVSDARDLFQSNILTLGQAADMLPMDIEVVEEFRDKYKFELDPGQNPFDQLSQDIQDSVEVEQSELQDFLEDE